MEDMCECRSMSEDTEACDQTIPDLDDENIICRDTLPGYIMYCTCTLWGSTWKVYRTIIFRTLSQIHALNLKKVYMGNSPTTDSTLRRNKAPVLQLTSISMRMSTQCLVYLIKSPFVAHQGLPRNVCGRTVHYHYANYIPGNVLCKRFFVDTWSLK